MTNQKKLQALKDVESCVSSKTGKSEEQPKFPIAKLKEAEVIHINQAEIVITWSINSQQEHLSDNPESFQDSRMDSEIPECILKNQNKFQDSRMNSEIPENQSSEALHSKESSTPQIIQTYKDFKKTLSKEARESFEKFVREEYFLTEGKKIRSFTAFMSDDHFQEWYEKYQNRPEAIQIAQNTKWENHPRRDEWLEKIRTMGNFSFRTEGGKLDNDRDEFWHWVVDNGLLEDES